MDSQPQIAVLEKMIEALIADEPTMFLVDLRIKPTNNIKVFIDGDQGVSIDKLVQLNRKMYKEIEEGGFYPNGDFSLEVSSPGLDEPLKLPRQYQKNIGRVVEVQLIDGSKNEGKLLSVADEEIVIEEDNKRDKKGKAVAKAKEVLQQAIPFSNIKTVKIQIKF